MCVARLHWLPCSLRCMVKHPRFVSCHYAVQKVVTLLLIVCDRWLRCSHSIFVVPFTRHFWQPSCTQLSLAQPFSCCLIKNCSWHFRALFMKFIHHYMLISAKFFLNFLNNGLPLLFSSWTSVLPAFNSRHHFAMFCLFITSHHKHWWVGDDFQLHFLLLRRGDEKPNLALSGVWNHHRHFKYALHGMCYFDCVLWP